MKRIAIVEDDVFMREELVHMLKKAGYETLEIHTFQNTAEQLYTFSPDLVVLDINLPGISGFQICREEWAHEIKTPLSLLTMILDNRRDEISPQALFKLDYIHGQLQEDVNQILYYARLKSTQKDYLFESVNLGICIKEVLEDYKPLLTEKQFLIQNQVTSAPAFTDQRGIRFILSQIISNAIKYSTDAPELTIMLEHTHTTDVLSIQDNGMGVRSCDLPYIFEKGFTGETADNRKKATGMGLYLSKKMADDLGLRLDVQSEWKKGFKISICFPIINEKNKLHAKNPVIKQ